MLEFFKQFAEIVQASLEYLELDEDIRPEEVHGIELESLGGTNWKVSFPEWEVEYFANCWTSWSGQEADWQFLR